VGQKGTHAASQKPSWRKYSASKLKALCIKNTLLLHHVIEAHAEGVWAPIAASANAKYYAHRILAPEILTKPKNEFHKKYAQR